MILVSAILLEVGVALAIRELRILGLVHAALIAAVGFYAVLRKDLTLVICAIAYVAGSEVLWRQARAPVFYLAAPYIVITLSAFAVLFVLQRLGRDARLAVLYAALLLPATVATVRTAGEGARELISFALSGPLALAAFVAFTSQVRIERWLYRRVMWITLIGAIGPLTIALFSLRTELAAEGSIEFSGQSNAVTSGGFGPVQVSSVLSMGIMAAIMLILTERDRTARIIASVLAFVLAVQTLLTFSRGGSFSLGIAMAVFAVTQARNRRIRNRIIVIAGTALALAYFVVFPWLETFTEGRFEERFSDTESARTELAANDTEIFARNFAFGVGPGMTKYQRLTYEICQLRSDQCRNEASSHTEFTRMMGEHGIPGVIAIVLLVMLAWHAFSRAGPGREFAVAWVTWTIAQMFYANLRVVAVPIAFGFAFLRFSDGGDGRGGSSETERSTPPAGPTPAEIRARWRPDLSLQRLSANGISTADALDTARATRATLAAAEPLPAPVEHDAVRPQRDAPDPQSLPDPPDLAMLPDPPASATGRAAPPLAPDLVIPPSGDRGSRNQA